MKTKIKIIKMSKKIKSHLIKSVISGDKSVDVKLITNMSNGKSHLELSFEKRLQLKTSDEEKILNIAEQIMRDEIDLKDVENLIKRLINEK